MNYTKGQLRDRLNKLPNDIQQELSSDDLGLIIQIIGSDAGITPEQSLDVEDEVVMVLMGTSHPKDFIRNIQSKIGVDQEKAHAIAEKVNDEIFQPVKESLKIVHNIKDEGASQQALSDSEASVASVSASVEHPTPNIPLPPVPPTPPGSTLNAPRSTANTFPQMIVPPIPQGASLASEASIVSIPKIPEAPKPSQNIFEQKLQGVFKMPKEETLVPQKPSSPPTPPTPPRPSGIDPYREPAK